MALRLTRANSEYLSITTGIFDINAAYTVAGWVYLVTNGINQGIFHAGAVSDWNDSDVLHAGTGDSRCYSSVGGTFTAGTGGTTAAGVWIHVAVVRSSVTSFEVFYDGVSVCSNARDITGRTAAAILTLGEYEGGGYADQRRWGWKAWTRALTVAELTAESKQALPVSALSLYGVWPFLAGATRAKDFSGKGHDWTENNTPTDEDPPDVAFGDGDPIWFLPPAATGPTYTLAVDVGSYALTGTTVDFLRAYSLAADVGSYALTGTAVDFVWARSMVVDPGVYALTGTAVDFVRGYTLVVDVGSYSLTGTSVDLLLGRLIVVDPGAYTLTGTDVTFTLSSTTYTLAVDPGVYTVTGTAVTLVAPAMVIVTVGEWSTPVTLLAGQEWMITLAGPSCDAPRARVDATFLSS